MGTGTRVSVVTAFSAVSVFCEKSEPYCWFRIEIFSRCELALLNGSLVSMMGACDPRVSLETSLFYRPSAELRERLNTTAMNTATKRKGHT
jgi:hypothetical protein